MCYGIYEESHPQMYLPMGIRGLQFSVNPNYEHGRVVTYSIAGGIYHQPDK